MIIGIVGRTIDPQGNWNALGAGKDTVANILFKELGFAHASLAAPMKDFVADVFGFSYAQVWGPSHCREIPNERGVTPRRALQTLGTDWGRSLDEDVWIRRLLESADYLDRVVVSDVRFRNELRAIQDHPRGKLMLVERHVMHTIEPVQHQSERDLDAAFSAGDLTWDVEILNNGTLDALKANVLSAMRTTFGIAQGGHNDT